MQVSYYTNTPMYRHQQAVAAAQPQFHTGSTMHSWYPGYHQGNQSAASGSYCMQDEQQVAWHHSVHHPHMYHQEYNDFVHAGGSSLPPQLQQVGEGHDTQLPSPPITVSGSEMSSPGAGGNSPANSQNRPAPARSPYEWIKKTSYQTQPNPGESIGNIYSII